MFSGTFSGPFGFNTKKTTTEPEIEKVEKDLENESNIENSIVTDSISIEFEVELGGGKGFPQSISDVIYNQFMVNNLIKIQYLNSFYVDLGPFDCVYNIGDIAFIW